MGTPPGQAGWLVHLRDPSNRVDPAVMLSDSSVSTSEQTPPSLLSPEQAGHIIDPDSGAPVKTPFAVSVVAKTGTASDALSTTLLLVGPERGVRSSRPMRRLLSGLHRMANRKWHRAARRFYFRDPCRGWQKAFGAESGGPR